MFTWLRRRRRAAILRKPFPAQWVAILERNVPDAGLLTAEELYRLKRDLQVFVAEKRWEGCGGLAVTDEMRVTVAAWACLLVLQFDHDYYRRVQSILLYPRGYLGPETRYHDLIGPPDVRLGEAWYRGPVVLSWEDVLRSAEPDANGNVTLHEFAHQLDMLDRVVDGTPPLATRGQYQNWARIMTAEYDRLLGDWQSGRPTVLDPYGTTNEGEFFAVATEAFFQKPLQLERRHPRLYSLLRDYYRQDTAERMRRHLAGGHGEAPKSGGDEQTSRR